MLFKASKFFLYASVFSIALVTTSTLFPFIVGKYAWFRGTVDLALIFFLLGVLFEADGAQYLARLKTFFKSPVVIAVTAFVGAYLLACFFGVRPSFSFWSNFERGEGGIQLLNLYVFFLLLITLFKEEKEWRKLVWCSMITAVLMILYGVIAGFGGSFLGWGNIGPRFSMDGFRFQGSVGNAEYVPGYLIFMLFFAAYQLISSKRSLRSSQSLLVVACMVLFLMFCVASGTRGAFIGMIAGGLAGLGYIGWYRKAWRKWLLGGAAAVVILLALLVQFGRVPAVHRIPGVESILRLSLHPTDLADLHTRFVMWGVAYEAWKERPVFGWGPENFLIAYDHHFDITYFEPTRGFEAWFDRAHSVIFDYLSMTGAVGLLSYLSVFVCLGLLLLRKRVHETAKTDPRGLLLQAAFLGILVTYLVQGTVLFDVFALYLPLFMLFAFAVWHFEKPALPARPANQPNRP